MPEISVIILNYNGGKWLRGCLDALAAQTGAPPFEILLFDNGSSDDSVGLARAYYPDVRIVRSDTNLGFAEGNNTAARHARGAWLAFLNNDTRPFPDWLAQLSLAARRRGASALVTSRVVFLDAPSLVDSAGDGYLRAGGAYKLGHGGSAEAFETEREVFGACGAAFMIHRDSFASLNGFDPRFFMVYEDVDLSYRARLRGMRCWYAPAAIVGHAGSGSIGVASPAIVFYGQRNLEWTWIKNTPGALLLRSAIPHVFYSAAGVLHYLVGGRGLAALRGKVAALAGLPSVLRDRRRVQATRTVETRALTALMTEGWLSAKRREKRFDRRRR